MSETSKKVATPPVFLKGTRAAAEYRLSGPPTLVKPHVRVKFQQANMPRNFRLGFFGNSTITWVQLG